MVLADITPIPFICAFVSFLVVWYTTPWFIRYLKKIGLVVKDMNKKDSPLVPLSGGITVMSGIFIGLMMFIFFWTFLPENSALTIDSKSLLILFASMTTILLITFIGFVDDILIKKSKESSIGLKQWQKPLLTLAAAIPLVVINAGFTKIWIPFIGSINVQYIYPLLFIPLGVVGAANMVNLLGGITGLEVGMGIIYTGMLGLYAYSNGRFIAALIALLTFVSLLAFFYYNKYPAKIFPGDSLTYLLGAVIAVIAIIGNIEKAALIASIPFFMEFVLKARSKFKAQCYGYYKNGKVQSLYNNKIYSLVHIFTRKGLYTEKQITYIFMFIELIFCSLIWII